MWIPSPDCSNGGNSSRIRLLVWMGEGSEALSQQLLGAVQARHHRAQRNVERLGDLLVAELAECLQGDGIAIVRRQARDRVTDGALHVVARGDVLRICFAAGGQLLHAVER